MDETKRVSLSKVIKFYKVQWEHHTEEEATWEREEFLRASYLELSSKQPNLKDDIQTKWGRFVTPWFSPS